MKKVNEIFEGGVAFITGAGAGIGEGLARYAASLKMKVAVADINLEAAEKVASDINRQGGEAKAYKVDVRSYDEVTAVANQVYKDFGSVTLLINNAGIEQFGYLWDTPLENWERLVDINITGVFNGVKAFLPKMIEAKQACQVWNLSSMGGVTAAARQAPYIMSKHAVLGLTECLRLDVEASGNNHINVCAVLPGVVTSDIFKSAGGVDKGETHVSDSERKSMLDIAQKGITPLLAAERVFEQAANGDFYLLTQVEMVSTTMNMRAEQLRKRTAPYLYEGEFVVNNN